MKKRILTLLSIIVLMVVLMSSLVACVPSRPDKFIQRLLAANSWSATTFNTDGKVTAINAKDGNIIYASSSSVEQYMILGKSSIETYTYKDEKWSYVSSTNKDEIDKLRDPLLHQTVDDLGLSDLPSLKEISKNFTEKFKKEDGKWYERNTKPACIYVKGGVMYYETSAKHKTFCFTIGSGLKLPKEAEQAKKDANA